MGVGEGKGRGQQLFNNCKLPRTAIRVHTIFIHFEPFLSSKIRNNNVRYIPQAKTVNTGYHCAICIYIYLTAHLGEIKNLMFSYLLLNIVTAETKQNYK